MFEKDDSSNRKKKRLLLAVSFNAKFGLAFVLTLENTFS